MQYICFFWMRRTSIGEHRCKEAQHHQTRKDVIIFLYIFRVIFLWHKSSCISTLSLPCLFLLRLWTEASLGWLSLAALLLRLECSTPMIIFSQLFWLSPVLSWGCHNSNHAVSFLGQRLSTINVSWWLGCIQCRVCLTSIICTYCAVCECQTSGSLQSVFCWTRPLPVLPLLGRHKLSGRERAVSSAWCSHISVPSFLQALVNVALTTLS